MRLAILLFFVSVNCFAQNIYQVISKTPQALKIGRTVIVSPPTVNIAERALSAQSTKILTEKINKQVILQTVINQPICKPEEVAGGYNYLRVANKEMHNAEGWEEVACSSMYNGAHHIINKSVLEVIFTDLRFRARTHGKVLPFNLADVQNNAPAMFHIYHNHPRYRHFFHDRDRQLMLYYSKGIFGVLDDFLARVDEMNKAEGLPLYSDDFKRTTLLEGELWAKHYGLKWRK